MQALEEELNGLEAGASYVPAYNPYDLNAPAPPASARPTKYQDLDPWHKAQTHNEWELLQRRLSDRLRQHAVANNVKLQQDFTFQYRRKEEECLRYHLNQQVTERDNARALASTIRNIHRNAPEELGDVIQNLCRDLAYEFLSAFEASVDPDFPWKATCEGTKQQFISIMSAGRDASGDDHKLDAQAYLIGYFECIARLVEQPSTVMGQQFRTIAGAVLGRHPFGTVNQRFVSCAKYLCTEIRANRLPLSVIVNLVQTFVVVMRDAWFTAWKDANRACRGKLHEFFAIAIQHVVFLRCPEIEALFAEPTAQAVSIDDRLQDLYEHCAVPEAWRVFPPVVVLTNGEAGGVSLLEALPHTPYERPTQELRVLAQAKTPLEIVAVLHRTVNLIMEVCSRVDSSIRHLAADDVIPLLSLCFNLSIRHPTMGLDPGLLRTKFRFCDTFLPDHLANGAHGYILTVAQTGMHMVT